MSNEKHGDYGYEDHGHCRVCGGYNGHHFVEKHSGETNPAPTRRSGGSAALLILLLVGGALGVLIPPVGVVMIVIVLIMAAMK